MIRVDEIMTEELICVDRTATLADAAKLMNENRIRHIPVVDRRRTLVGLVTQRDAVAAHGDREAVRVEDVMTTKLITADPSAHLISAARLMQKHKIGCLPVVDGDLLVGIITDSDYVALSINLLEQLEENEPEPLEEAFDEEIEDLL